MKYRKHRSANTLIPGYIMCTFLTTRRYFSAMINYRIRVVIDFKYTKQRFIYNYKRRFRSSESWYRGIEL